MAKKKTAKKTVGELTSKAIDLQVTINEGVLAEIARLDRLVEHLAQSIHNINNRIERIVEAHEKCKSLKGL